MGRLDGKVALITGAARGMGEAEARLFAREGARVALADVLDEACSKVAAELTAASHASIALHLDVSDEASWQTAIAGVEDVFGHVDVLVNNAGIADAAGVEATGRELWERIVAVNQTGVWLGMKSVAPAMRRAGGGSIVNISSIYGIVGSTGSAAYHASKGAVRVLSKTAALEFAADGIRVNSVHPGYVDTEMLRATVETAADQARLDALVAASTPLGRVGSALDVALAVLYLASDESAFVTGAELVVDGGYTAR